SHHSRKSPSGGISELAASIHLAHLAARLDATLSVPTLVRLQRNPRLQVRLAKFLLGPETDVDGCCRDADLLLGRDPRRAALLAGSIWHACSLLRLVAKHDLSILVGYIGAEAHAFGIRHSANAVATEAVADPERFSQQIEHDGHACLGAWLNEAPALDR